MKRPGRGLRNLASDPGGASVQLGAGLRESSDLAAASLVVVGAAFAVAYLPEAHPMRVLLAAAVLLFAPGYLLIQAFVAPAAAPRRRLMHALVGIGVSPAVVGLAALATALIDNGFRPASIVVAVTAVSLAFASIALYRRAYRPPLRDASPTLDGATLEPATSTPVATPADAKPPPSRAAPRP